jgi:hypothetical protein
MCKLVVGTRICSASGLDSIISFANLSKLTQISLSEIGIEMK